MMTDVRTLLMIRQVAETALVFAETLVPELLPEGKRRGSEWWARNPVRGDREAGSFSVSLTTGRWHDFASGDRGGDLVALAAYLWGMRQSDAAKALGDRLGVTGLDAVEPAQYQQRMTQARAEAIQRQRREQEQRLNRQQKAALKALQYWQAAVPASPEHPYLTRKQIAPHGLRQHGKHLLVPLQSLSGALVNVQRIAPDGSKRFWPGALVSGAFHVMGSLKSYGRAYLCEGFATGATLFEHYEQADAVVCAMNAGNLKPVAMALHHLYGPNLELIVAGDDDRETEGNPGRTAANAAALAAGGMTCFPDWPEQAPSDLSDFNDLYLWEVANDL